VLKVFHNSNDIVFCYGSVFLVYPVGLHHHHGCWCCCCCR